MVKNERTFSKMVVEELRENYNAYVIKAEGIVRGLPDLIVCIYGEFFGLELKLGSTYKVQPHQILQIEKIRSSGGKAFCLTYSEDWKKELKRMIFNKTYKQEFEKIEWD